MIAYTNQYMYRFQNKGCINSTQNPVKIDTDFQVAAILFFINIFIHMLLHQGV